MKNEKILPFERNRYYTGKLLTSLDFQAEQEYFNNKRRFINKVMYGSGIACGMSVTKADEVSVRIESGAAVDGFGREIVLPVDIIKKLSVIEGFERIKSGSMNLYIDYDEKEIQPVYSTGKADLNAKYENNHIEEKYRLFLVDEAEDRRDIEEPSDFLITKTLFETVDYKLDISMPAVVCAGRWIKIKVTAYKMSDAEAELSFKGEVQFTGLTAENGKNMAAVVFEKTALKKGRWSSRVIWVRPSALLKGSESHVMFPREAQECTINGAQVPCAQDILFQVVCEDIEPENLVEDYIGKINYKRRGFDFGKKAVFLARIFIRRAFESYEITDIDDVSRRKYIQVPSSQKLAKEYLGYFRENHEVGGNFAAETKLKKIKTQTAPAVRIASGIAEIPIGRKLKKGEVCFSAEIVHGLGAWKSGAHGFESGNVHVALGFVSHSGKNFGKGPALLFGAGDIFENESEAGSFDTAVKVLNDKGSFIIGIRAKRDVECSVLKYRWYAADYSGGETSEHTREALGHRIIVQTPTKVLEPGERSFFNVRFENMEPAPLGYELTEYGSGEITPDGVYTAPDKNGVFEIRIFCMEEPETCTYAYAIVKKQDEGV